MAESSGSLFSHSPGTGSQRLRVEEDNALSETWWSPPLSPASGADRSFTAAHCDLCLHVAFSLCAGVFIFPSLHKDTRDWTEGHPNTV